MHSMINKEPVSARTPAALPKDGLGAMVTWKP
jgi:hypothetical protein